MVGVCGEFWLYLLSLRDLSADDTAVRPFAGHVLRSTRYDPEQVYRYKDA